MAALYLQGAPLTGALFLRFPSWNSDNEFLLCAFVTGLGFAATNLTTFAEGDLLGQFIMGMSFFSFPLYILNLVVYPLIAILGEKFEIPKTIQTLLNRPISLIVTGCILSPIFGSVSLGSLAAAPSVMIATITSIFDSLYPYEQNNNFPLLPV